MKEAIDSVELYDTATIFGVQIISRYINIME